MTAWIARILFAAFMCVWFYVMAWMAGAAWALLSDAFVAGMEAVRWL